MVWNTIAHPKMMNELNAGWSDNGGENNQSFVRYANNYKLGVYDIMIDMGNESSSQMKLISGDFTELKKKLFSGEIIKGLAVGAASGMFVSYDLDKYMYHAKTDEDSECITMFAYIPSGASATKTMMEMPFILLPDNTVEGG